MTKIAATCISMGKKLLVNDWMNCVTLAIERSSRAMIVPVTWLS